MEPHARPAVADARDIAATDDSALVIVLLCLAAGYVDAIGYMHHQVFAANMTGNTVLAGMSLAQQQWGIAAERAATLLAFFGGAALSGMCAGWGGRFARLSLLAEAVLLAVASALDADRASWLWLTAVAMGMQGTVMLRRHRTTVSTVVITSTIARLAQAVAGFAVPVGPAAPAAPVAPRAAAGMLALSWLLYCIGAVVAALLSGRMPHALAIGAVLVVAAALVQRRGRHAG